MREQARLQNGSGEVGNATPVFVLDREGTFAYVNEDAEGIFGKRRRELEGETFWAQVPESLVEEYRRPFERVLERQESAEFETLCPVTDRWYRFQVYPCRDRITVHAHDIEDQMRRERALEVRERALRSAHAIVADRDRSVTETVEGLLAVIRSALGAELGTLSRVEPGENRYRFLAVDAAGEDAGLEGQIVPLDELPNCAEVVDTRESLVLADVEEQAPRLADETWGIQAYVGAPVRLDGAVYGTFCFYSTVRRSEAFSDWEATYVDMFAEWVGAELEQAGGWPELG